MNMKEFEQKQYEEVIGRHIDMLDSLEEVLINAAGEQVVVDHMNAVLKVKNQKLVLEQLNSTLVLPDWYTKKMKELGW